jgi:hypothetical protein
MRLQQVVGSLALRMLGAPPGASGLAAGVAVSCGFCATRHVRNTSSNGTAPTPVQPIAAHCQPPVDTTCSIQLTWRLSSCELASGWAAQECAVVPEPPLRLIGGPCSTASGPAAAEPRRGAFAGRSVSRSLRSTIHSRKSCMQARQVHGALQGVCGGLAYQQAAAIDGHFQVGLHGNPNFAAGCAAHDNISLWTSTSLRP